MLQCRPHIMAALVASVFVLQAPTQADAVDVGFQKWLSEFRAEALADGIRPATLDVAFANVEPIERVIELDRHQPEGTITFEQYLDRVISDARVEQGRRMLKENRAILEQVAKEFGVQPRFIVALWGIETSYGNFTGGFPVVGALATLAYDGRRSKYFRGELLNALHVLQDGHVPLQDMVGSWAGAMGQTQFMPSSFLDYATDFDGDGAKNIWTSRPDVFASAANYLRNVGWRDDITWGRRVRLPPGFDPELADLDVVKQLSEWQGLGVRRADGSALPTRDLNASIVLPGGTGGPAYVVYDNYRSILRWNRSFYFATAVGHLSDRIDGRG